MTPEQTVDVLRWLLEHRFYDDMLETHIVDYDQLVGYLLEMERVPVDDPTRHEGQHADCAVCESVKA